MKQALEYWKFEYERKGFELGQSGTAINDSLRMHIYTIGTMNRL